MESMAKDQHRNFVIGEWTVKPAMNQIVRDRQARSLQPQSMNVLAYLAQYAGEVVSSEQLLEAFWPNRVAGDDAVHRRIADLRKHLEDDAKHPIYIQTIPKRGYRLVAPVEFEPLLPAPPDALPSASGSRLGAGAVGTSLIALVLLCAGAYLAWSHRTAEQREAAIATAQALLDEDRHQEAYRALEPWLDSGSGPRLDALLEAITLPISIATRPAGIQVSDGMPARTRSGSSWLRIAPDRLSPKELGAGDEVRATCQQQVGNNQHHGHHYFHAHLPHDELKSYRSRRQRSPGRTADLGAAIEARL